VSVRPFAAGAHALHPEAVRDYLGGLDPHLQASAKTMHTLLSRSDRPPEEILELLPPECDAWKPAPLLMRRDELATTPA